MDLVKDVVKNVSSHSPNGQFAPGLVVWNSRSGVHQDSKPRT